MLKYLKNIFQKFDDNLIKLMLFDSIFYNNDQNLQDNFLTFIDNFSNFQGFQRKESKSIMIRFLDKVLFNNK